MKSNFISAAGLFITNFFGHYTYAQGSTVNDSVVQWDLATAIAYAKENNIQVNIIKLDEKLSEQDLLLARAARYPNLNGSATQSITHSGNTNPVVGGFQTQSSAAGNYSVNSAWTVYRGGYLNYDVKSKGLALQAANLNVDVAQNNITLQITEAYLNILLSNEGIGYIQQLVATSQAQYEQGKTRYNAGGISKKDLLQL